MTRIDEIKARLAAATPGPWEPCERGAENPVIKGQGSFIENGEQTNLFMAMWPCHDIADTVAAEDLTYNNIELAANAPADIAFLIGEIERLEEDIAGLCGYDSAAEMRADNEEHNRLQRALEGK